MINLKCVGYNLWVFCSRFFNYELEKCFTSLEYSCLVAVSGLHCLIKLGGKGSAYIPWISVRLAFFSLFECLVEITNWMNVSGPGDSSLRKFLITNSNS